MQIVSDLTSAEHDTHSCRVDESLIHRGALFLKSITDKFDYGTRVGRLLKAHQLSEIKDHSADLGKEKTLVIFVSSYGGADLSNPHSRRDRQRGRETTP